MLALLALVGGEGGGVGNVLLGGWEVDGKEGVWGGCGWWVVEGDKHARREGIRRLFWGIG